MLAFSCSYNHTLLNSCYSDTLLFIYSIPRTAYTSIPLFMFLYYPLHKYTTRFTLSTHLGRWKYEIDIAGDAVRLEETSQNLQSLALADSDDVGPPYHSLSTFKCAQAERLRKDTIVSNGISSSTYELISHDSREFQRVEEIR